MSDTAIAQHELHDFIDREHPRLVRTLTSYTGDRDLAEELAAETLVRMIRDWDRIGSLAAPGAYAHRTAINLASSWFRRRAAHRRAIARHGADEEVHHDPDGASAIAVREAVAGLPDQQRAAVALHHLAGFTTAEVAEQLGVAPGTVRSNLHHARAHLREVLGTEPELAPTAVEPRVRRQEIIERSETVGRRRTAAGVLALVIAAGVAIGWVVAAIGEPERPIVDQAPGSEEALPLGVFADGAVAVGDPSHELVLDVDATDGLQGDLVARIDGAAVAAVGPDGSPGVLRDGVLELHRDGEVVASTDARTLLAAAGVDDPLPQGTAEGHENLSLAIDAAGRLLLHHGPAASASVVALSPDGTTEVLLTEGPVGATGPSDDSFVALDVAADGAVALRVVDVAFLPEGLRWTTQLVPVAGPAPRAEEIVTELTADVREINEGQLGILGAGGIVYGSTLRLAIGDVETNGTLQGVAPPGGGSSGSGTDVWGNGTIAILPTVATDEAGQVTLLIALREDGRSAVVDLGVQPPQASPMVAVDGSVHLVTTIAGGTSEVRRVLGPDLLPAEGATVEAP